MFSITPPSPLRAGARVALVAPAGPLRGTHDIERAESNARALGWEPVVIGEALSRQRYTAGSDAQRLAALAQALANSSIDAIWCLRGGYGSMRLLDAIDYELVRRRRCPVIGFSDITALHHAFAARAGVSGIHGPCARGALPPFSRESLAHVTSGRDSCGAVPGARVLRTGRARGPMVGGNMALLSALVGTPYLFVPQGAILVMEDVHEPVYRIDRMLRQLRLSGVLDRCGALLFGAFTDRGDAEDADNDADALSAVLEEAAGWVRVPVLSGVPVGHIDEQWSWPFGVIAEVDADTRRVSVSRE